MEKKYKLKIDNLNLYTTEINLLCIMQTLMFKVNISTNISRSNKKEIASTCGTASILNTKWNILNQTDSLTSNVQKTEKFLKQLFHCDQFC